MTLAPLPFIRQMQNRCALAGPVEQAEACSTLTPSLYGNLRFEDDLCKGGVAVMRDSESDILHAETVGDRARRA
jgi:hypothetical protein